MRVHNPDRFQKAKRNASNINDTAQPTLYGVTVKAIPLSPHTSR